MLNEEFFKFFGNLTNDDLIKLAKHILNQIGDKRVQPYPKVTIRQTVKALERYYSTKDWIERAKWKTYVKKELTKLDPSLGLVNANKNVVPARWKDFKLKFNITSATLNVLLERPGEEYFLNIGQKKLLNKSTDVVSSQVVDFFKTFPDAKKNFIPPSAVAYYAPYDISRGKHSN